jgi:hypothetical protein
MSRIKAGPDRGRALRKEEVDDRIRTAMIPPSAMKSVFDLVSTLLLAGAIHGSTILEPRTKALAHWYI